jgi:GH15 family glucan-1,4-alpha-glucosidase
MSEHGAVVETTGGMRAERPRYRPISEYGAIGDCRTAALVAPDGAIDWCCLPHFDSPAIFCRLLDATQGGYFQIAPVEEAQSTMRYLPGTNVLETTFAGASGTVNLIDFMPVRHRRPHHPLPHTLQDITTWFVHDRQRVIERDIGNDVAAAHRLARWATVTEGQVVLDLVLKATFDFARAAHQIDLIALDEHAQGAILWAGNRFMALVVRHTSAQATDPPLRLRVDDGVISAQAAVMAGQHLEAHLNYARTRTEAEQKIQQWQHNSSVADLDETIDYWRGWSDQCRYTGPYRDMVLRSALALKLCTFEPTGAIVAAPTTSLPEAIGGPRNWDYRYTWLRDSAFTLDALDALGYTQEARDYFHFLHDLHLRRGNDLHIMYGIHGESGEALHEETLTHLDGYRGSRPVRIGNGAADQRQLDVYGELIDAAARYLTHSGYHAGQPFAMHDVRTLISQVANYVAQHWQDTDQGIWEVRGEPRAFVYSRAMCWTALDRACRLVDGRTGARWRAMRDQIHADILTHGYDVVRQTFVQSYGSSALDAANLRLPLAGFVAPTGEHTRGTVAATLRELAGPHGLLYRYRTEDHPAKQHGAPAAATTDDGLAGGEGAFVACTFWLINVLCDMGRVDDARQRFEKLLKYASPLGLFAEEIDFQTGAPLGNYPQALTHIGLINAAVHLERATGG